MMYLILIQADNVFPNKPNGCPPYPLNDSDKVSRKEHIYYELFPNKSMANIRIGQIMSGIGLNIENISVFEVGKKVKIKKTITTHTLLQEHWELEEESK